MTSDQNHRSGQCHCGAVKFEVVLSDGIEHHTASCTCSYCRMREQPGLGFRRWAIVRIISG